MSNNSPNAEPKRSPVAGDAFNADVQRQDVSLVQLATVLLRHRRPLIVIPSALLAVVVGIILLAHRTYTTTISFTPVSSPAAQGALASLAGQFGVQLPGSDPSTSPDFYAGLVETPSILRALAKTKYTFKDQGKALSGSFIELYELGDTSSGATVFKAQHLLQSNVLGVSYDRQTSIVSVDVQTKWAPLSRQMAERLLQLIDEFNLNSRQRRAQAEREFMEQRLDSAKFELRAAENRLQDFLEHNRDFRSDPRLSFENDRLTQEENMRQQIVSTLTQAVEQDRIEAVRNTPSISVLEEPSDALQPDRRHLLLKGSLALAGGFAMVVIWLLIAEVLRSGKADTPGQYEELERTWRETRRHPFLARKKRTAKS